VVENTSKPSWLPCGIDVGCGFIKQSYIGPDSKPTDGRNDQTGLDSTPNSFLFLKGEILWGEAAHNARILCPQGYVLGEDIKLNLGNPSWRFCAPDGKQWTSQELYSLAAARAAALLERSANGKRVVVQPTFPENFTEGARREVIAAFKKAGIEILDPISEPVAAAYYLASQGEFQVAVVIDVGHGTTDVSVVQFEGKTLRVRAHSGIPRLGGRNFRNLIEEAFLKDADCTASSADPTHVAFRQELRASAERAKITLSSVSEATIVATPPGSAPHAFTLTRDRFESMALSLAAQITNLARTVVSEAKLQPRDATWLLVGGGSRIPLLAKHLHSTLGIVAKVHPEASNAIARGGALLAAEKLREGGRNPVDSEGRPTIGPGIGLVTAAPHTLGVLCSRRGDPSGPRFLSPLILRNTAIPPEGKLAAGIYHPVRDMQETALINIAQGEPDASESMCHVIGEAVLRFTIPADRQTKFEIGLRYSCSGLVQVEARDLRDGTCVKCEVRAPGTPAAEAA
jgi:molecular chaperone DnaK